MFQRVHFTTHIYFYKADFLFDFNDKEKDNHKKGRTQGGGTRYIKWKENEGTGMGLKKTKYFIFSLCRKMVKRIHGACLWDI